MYIKKIQFSALPKRLCKNFASVNSPNVNEEEKKIPLATVNCHNKIHELPPDPAQKNIMSNLSASIIHESENILVINKPYGLPVYSSSYHNLQNQNESLEFYLSQIEATQL